MESDICFGGLKHDQEEGEKFLTRIIDSGLSNRYTSIVKNCFEASPRQLVSWWYDEVEIMGLPVEKEEFNQQMYIKWVTQDRRYIGSLAKLTIFDFPHRAPGMLWVYSHLRSRLPNENPYLLFQMVHQLPYSHIATWKGVSEEYKNKIGFAFRLPCMNSGHMLGSQSGEADLYPNIQESFDSLLSKRGGTLNGTFFNNGNPDRCIDPQWTLDEYAEYVKQFIDNQQALF
jgi:hypothetical protein